MLKIILPLMFYLPTLFSNFFINSAFFILMMSFLIMTMNMPKSITFYVMFSNSFIDYMSISLILLSMWVTILMVLSSLNTKNMKKYTLLMLILCFILILTFSAPNLMTFFIFFEASLIPTFLMILGWGGQPERLKASTYLLLYTISASLPLLIAINMLKMNNFSLSFIYPFMFINSFSYFTPLWMFLLIFAFLVKLPMYFLHLWLPKAHVEAPVAGSMILAALLLKLGGYGMVRIIFLFWTKMQTSIIYPFLSGLSLWGATLSALICLRLSDLKALIAYSSVSHMSLIILNLLSGKMSGFSASLTMMIAHGLTSSGLFEIANTTANKSRSRALTLNKGIIASLPSLSFWWFLLIAGNMGAPPSINLSAELYLMITVISSSYKLIFPLIIMIVLSGGYSLLLYVSVNHGNPLSLNSIPKMSTFCSHTTKFLHMAPLIILIMKLDLMLFYPL